MKPLLADWSIVLVGSWNIAILNPEWLGENVFKEAQFGAEILLVDGVRPQLRIPAIADRDSD